MKSSARLPPAAMDLDSSGRVGEFNGKSDSQGCSFSNKKDSHVGLGTGVDFETELTLPKWCGMLTPMVLRTRSSFAFYLLKSFRLERSTMTSSTTLFPIPLPFTGLFDRMPPNMSVRDRRSLSFRRAIYIVVFALNYWYFGGPPPDMSHLGRAPNTAHRRIYKRVESFIRSDFGMPSFRVAAAGRRFPQLVARLCELSESMTRLGLGGDTYTKSFAGAEDGFDADKIPELKPYRDLQADRLRLFGRAQWDITGFLSDDLILPFREPKSIAIDRVPEVWEYPKCNDPYDEILALARVWDNQNLLHLHGGTGVADRPYEKVRIFNAYKNAEMDRQIGDRRGRNAVEQKIPGPSTSLPTGPLLTDIVLNPRLETLRISISDRKDFYHQIRCTPSKAEYNTIGTLDLKDAIALKAFNNYQETKNVRYDRDAHGDRLGAFPAPRRKDAAIGLQAAFRGILQGDHGGVEFATDAHINLLKSFDVLDEHQHLTSTRACRDHSVMQGLVIDDYFAISVEKADTPVHHSVSYQMHHRAQRAYDSESILGSPAKDVLAEDFAKVIGAEIDSRPSTRRRGLVKIGAPAQKRYGLSWLSLNLAQLHLTSDTLHLSLIGGWVSALTYRRPMLGILNKSFALVQDENYHPSDPKVIPLSRRICDELVMVAILAPLMASNAGAGISQIVYATDASLEKGAILKAPIDTRVCTALIRTCRSKGGYTKLLSAAERLEIDEGLIGATPSPQRPIAMHYGFIEIFAGAAVVTKEMEKRG